MTDSSIPSDDELEQAFAAPAAGQATIAVGTFVVHVDELLGIKAFGLVYEAGQLEDGTPTASVAWLGGQASGPMPTDQLQPVT